MLTVQDEVVGLSSPEKLLTKPAPTGSSSNSNGTIADAIRGAFSSSSSSSSPPSSPSSSPLEPVTKNHKKKDDANPKTLISKIHPDLITTYHDLNPSTIDILTEDPSPLEFSRYVASNRPFILKNGATQWPATKSWSATYLAKTMSHHPVNVAITPHGNADSATCTNSKGPVFAKPHETQLPFSTLLHSLRTQEQQSQDQATDSPILYAQTQNDNLRNEYSSLFKDIPASIPFARIALAKTPEAINLWLGNSHSISALHKDNYENIYVQIRGKKHFVLMPPVEAPCVNERALLAGTYRPRKEASADGGAALLEKGDLCIVVDEPEEYVPFALWDPDVPAEYATEYSALARPLRVTLEEGDMLYLPALWYHKVSQSCDDEGICCAVNYWYDLDFGGGFWSMANFVRSVGLVKVD